MTLPATQCSSHRSLHADLDRFTDELKAAHAFALRSELGKPDLFESLTHLVKRLADIPSSSASQRLNEIAAKLESEVVRRWISQQSWLRNHSTASSGSESLLQLIDQRIDCDHLLVRAISDGTAATDELRRWSDDLGNSISAQINPSVSLITEQETSIVADIDALLFETEHIHGSGAVEAGLERIDDLRSRLMPLITKETLRKGFQGIGDEVARVRSDLKIDQTFQRLGFKGRVARKIEHLLWLVVIIYALMLIATPTDLRHSILPATEAILSVSLLADFGLRYWATPSEWRKRFLANNWLTSLVPAIPFGLLMSGSGGLTALLRFLRPAFILLRTLGLMKRAFHHVMRKLQPILSTTIQFYGEVEIAPDERTASRLQQSLHAHSQRLTEVWQTADEAQLEDAVSKLHQVTEEIMQLTQQGRDGVPISVRRSRRTVNVATVIDAIVNADEQDVERGLGAQTREVVSLLENVALLLFWTRLGKAARQSIRGRDTRSKLTFVHTLGEFLQGWHDILLGVGDLRGIISASTVGRFIVQSGTNLVKMIAMRIWIPSLILLAGLDWFGDRQLSWGLLVAVTTLFLIARFANKKAFAESMRQRRFANAYAAELAQRIAAREEGRDQRAFELAVFGEVGGELPETIKRLWKEFRSLPPLTREPSKVVTHLAGNLNIHQGALLTRTPTEVLAMADAFDQRQWLARAFEVWQMGLLNLEVARVAEQFRRFAIPTVILNQLSLDSPERQRQEAFLLGTPDLTVTSKLLAYQNQDFFPADFYISDRDEKLRGQYSPELIDRLQAMRGQIINTVFSSYHFPTLRNGINLYQLYRERPRGIRWFTSSVRMLTQGVRRWAALMAWLLRAIDSAVRGKDATNLSQGRHPASAEDVRRQLLRIRLPALRLAIEHRARVDLRYHGLCLSPETACQPAVEGQLDDRIRRWRLPAAVTRPLREVRAGMGESLRTFQQTLPRLIDDSVEGLAARELDALALAWHADFNQLRSKALNADQLQALIIEAIEAKGLHGQSRVSRWTRLTYHGARHTTLRLVSAQYRAERRELREQWPTLAAANLPGPVKIQHYRFFERYWRGNIAGTREVVATALSVTDLKTLEAARQVVRQVRAKPELWNEIVIVARFWEAAANRDLETEIGIVLEAAGLAETTGDDSEVAA